MKKSVLFLLIAVMVLSAIAFAVSADTETAESYEIALLVDVSGSMSDEAMGKGKGADPEKISIQAAKAFAYYYPYYAKNFNLSVIPYSTDTVIAVESVNVMEESGMRTYQEELDAIAATPSKGMYKGIRCWYDDTDIGKALVKAKEILAGSTADHKAVLLFTDGKIDLGTNDAGEELSFKNSNETAAAFAANGTPIYAVGLGNGVDKTYLKGLADTTSGEFLTCKSANELVDFFQNIYATFVGGTVINGETIQTQADVESKHTVNIYGQAISEANLVLFSTSKIKTYTVKNPNGVVVAELEADGKENTSSGCVVNRNDFTANIKLLNPSDGNWEVSFTSATAGTVQVGEIYLYNLKIADDRNEKVSVGETVKFNPVLYNADTDKRITTQAIYENSVCTITISRNGVNDAHTATLNDSKTGYTLEKEFDAPGEYEVTYRIENDQFEVETVEKMTVSAPNFKLSAANTSYEIGDTVEITCKFVDPVTGDEMDVPPYLSDFELTASVKIDGTEIYNGTAKYKKGDKIVYSYIPKASGDYEIELTATKFDDSVKSDAPLKFNVVGPKLILQAEKETIGRGDEAEVTLKLKNPITSSELNVYETFEKATVTAEVKIDGEAWKTFDVDVNKDKAGFKFTAPKKGAYTVSATIVSGNMTLESGVPLNIEVKDPEFKLVASKGEYHVNDGKIPFTLEIYDINGKKTDECPAFLEDYKIYFVSGDYKSESVTFEKFIADGGSFDFELKKSGEYDVTAVIVEGEDKYEITTKVNVKASEITVNGGGIPDFNKSTLSSTITEEIALNEIFVDGDGDELIFTVVSDNEGITSEVEGGKLVLKIKSKTEGKVTVKVSDGKGAEYVDEFSVAVKSTLPILITVIVIVVVIAIAIPVIIIFIKKRSVPRIKYAIKLSMNNNDVVYNINKASTNRLGKPLMTVKEILNISTLASESSGKMSEDDKAFMISNYCGKISVKGLVFKDAINVIFPDGKSKTFEKYMVTVTLPDDEANNNNDISITFGKNFDEEDLY